MRHRIIAPGKAFEALLRLPIDIPLATARDIDALFANMQDAPATVIVPSRDGTGTNALLRSPPTLFRSHFGPGSSHCTSMRRGDAARTCASCTIHGSSWTSTRSKICAPSLDWHARFCHGEMASNTPLQQQIVIPGERP